MYRGKYYKHALMILCYGASTSRASMQSKLGLRRTKVILKLLRSNRMEPFMDWRRRVYRGYLSKNAIFLKARQNGLTGLRADMIICDDLEDYAIC